MADQFTALGVKTIDDGDVVVKIVDSTASNTANVDASGNVSTVVNNGAGASAVNIQDGGNSITVDGSVTVTATDLDIRDLTHVSDSVKVGDGTDFLSITAAGEAEVIVNNTVDVAATDLDIRDLTHVSDSVRIGDGTDLATVTAAGELNVLATAQPGVDIGDVTINNAAGGSAVNIQDGGNSITVDAVNLDIRDLTHVSDSVRLGDGTDLVEVTAAGALSTDTTSIAGTATSVNNGTADAGTQRVVVASDNTPYTVKVSKDANANSSTNPIYVSVTDDDYQSATEVHNYDTTAAVAAGASDNHDYTITGTTFILKKIVCAASGAAKYTVQTGPVASLVTRAVMFATAANPTVELEFNPPIEVPATSTGTIRVIRYNNEIAHAQDVYSTIMGNDIP